MAKQSTSLLECPLLVAAVFITGIGGTFQYGFNIAVMTSPSLFIKELVNTTSTERYGLPLEEWQLTLIWSFLVSIFCVGGLLGSLLAVQMGKKYGRKQCLLMNNLVAIVAAVLMILSKRAVSFEMIMVARFLYGVNTGVILTVHPMYLVESAPKNLRGTVGVTTATFSSLGKFFAQLLGIKELLGTEDLWVWLLGFSGFVALFQLFTLPLLPESPRYLLLNRGDQEGFERAVKRLWGSRDYSVETQEMLQEKIELQDIKIHSVMELLQSRPLRWVVLTVIVNFVTIQLCGINAVYLYSTEVFTAAGIPKNQLNYVAFGTGLCEVISSVICAVAVGSIGRKKLLIGGYGCMAVTQMLLTITLNLQDHVKWMPYCSIVLIFLSIFSFSCGPSGVTMSLLAEFFTQSYKPAGYALACSINWVGLFVVGMVFPLLVKHLESYCFLIFLFFTIALATFVGINVPETNNLSPLEIQEAFRKMHSKTEKGGGPATPCGTTDNEIHGLKCQTKL
ncbi:solute carrier family 2 member 11, like [Gadus macrocephalus]|uniref:solute carrier family 2 member 11, like n=1 Tax=Gadus macrocephalus TaxID=80720 RepID=UPI0028CB3810|nr:solute carrier family 2 member 11, like [Gadus macrocephalus]